MGDKKITVQHLKDTIKRFTEQRGWDPHAKNLAISIAIEAAELMEHFQWDDYGQYQKDEKEKQKEIRKEIADVIVYSFEFAMKIGIDITQAVEEKLKANAKKYPAHLFKNKKRSGEIYYKIKAEHRKKK